MAAPRQLLLSVTTNTDQFVNLHCKSFKELFVTNADTEDIEIDVAIGKSNSAGTTSLTEGAKILQAVKIPTGVTMCLTGFDFDQLLGASAVTATANSSYTQPAISGALSGDDYTLLIRATATNKLFNLLIQH